MSIPSQSWFYSIWPHPFHSLARTEVKRGPHEEWKYLQGCLDVAQGRIAFTVFTEASKSHPFRINTHDYHRQHAPISGKIVDARVIPELCYLQIIPV